MKQVVLHLGLPKAGSSSIQATFYKNRRVLEAEGVRYAAFTEFGREIRSHSTALVNLFADNADRFHMNLKAGKTQAQQRARFEQELARNLAGDGVLVISGEDISALPRAALDRMAAHFEAAGWAVRPVLIVRPPAAFLQSFAQTVVKQGATGLLPQRKLASLLSRRITAIRRAMPQLEVYSFADAVAHPSGPPGFLADLIRPGLAGKLTEHRENTRISDNAVALIRHMNTVLPVWVDVPERRLSPLRLPGDVAPLFGLPGPRFYLRRAEIEARLPEIEAENAWLADHFGPGFCDEAPVPDDAPPVWDNSQAQALPRLLRRMPRHLRVAAASYFEGRDGLPPALAALPARHRMGGNLWLRYKRGGPGAATLERTYRKLRGQW